MPQHRVVSTREAPAAIGPYSQATVLPLGDRKLVFVAGQIPLDPESGELVAGSIEVQVRRVMENVGAILREAGSGFDRVVKSTIFLADLEDFAGCNAVYGEFFTGAPPARATVEVARLPKGVGVEIEVVAYT